MGKQDGPDLAAMRDAVLAQLKEAIDNRSTSPPVALLEAETIKYLAEAARALRDLEPPAPQAPPLDTENLKQLVWNAVQEAGGTTEMGDKAVAALEAAHPVFA
jgi:hypothetical protein